MEFKNTNNYKMAQDETTEQRGVPLPNIGETRPVNNENMIPNIIGTIISTYPRPNEPCRLCNALTTGTGNIRFLDAATGYDPFVIFVNENMFSNGLSFGELTDYEKVSSGRLLVTLMGNNGYIYLQKQIEISTNEFVTIAIVNTDSGIDIEIVADNGCDRAENMSCIRAANLAHDSGMLNVTIGNQYVNFPNMRYRAVTDFESLWPGLYIYTVSRSMMARFPEFGKSVLLTAPINLIKNRNYTIYLLSWNRESSDSIKALIVEEM